ncbi:MAG: transglycosylase SLT domain-containing protein [Geminicoccaceae bacterium]
MRDTAWAEAASPYDLDPSLLYAIALMESGRPRAGGLAPWPWTLWLPGQGGVYLDSREQALVTLRAHSGTAVDVGLMQVNLRWHGHRVTSPEELLEPERNLAIAAVILSEALATAPGDLELGIGRYHSPDETRARDYGRTVLTIWQRLRQLGGGVAP